MTVPCPFCNIDPGRAFIQGRLIFGVWEEKPVTPGHAILVTRRHVTDWFAASAAEQRELMAALTTVRDRILETCLPDGFNISIQVGRAAGQIVPHLQIHIVPRYRDQPSFVPQPDEPPPPPAPPKRPPASAAVLLLQPRLVENAPPPLSRLLPERMPEQHQAPAALPGTEAVEDTPSTLSLRLPAAATAPPDPCSPGAAGDSASTAGAKTADEAAASSSEQHGGYAHASGFDYYDDSMDESLALRHPRRRRWLLLGLLLLAGGGGALAYWRWSADQAVSPAGTRSRTGPIRAEPVNVLAETSDAQAKAGLRGGSSLIAPEVDGGAASRRPRLFSPPPDAGAGQGTYGQLVAQALAELQAGRQAQALPLFEQALKHNPDGWEALQHLALRDLKAGRTGRALKRARRALAAQADAHYAHLVVGVAMHERGRIGAAQASYQRFLKLCEKCREAAEIRRTLRTLHEEPQEIAP